jgi:hypothetical protein
VRARVALQKALVDVSRMARPLPFWRGHGWCLAFTASVQYDYRGPASILTLVRLWVRINATARVIPLSGRPLGAYLGGALAGILGLRATLVVAAARRCVGWHASGSRLSACSSRPRYSLRNTVDMLLTAQLGTRPLPLTHGQISNLHTC